MEEIHKRFVCFKFEPDSEMESDSISEIESDSESETWPTNAEFGNNKLRLAKILFYLVLCIFVIVIAIQIFY